jgi:hypothetical protein
MPEVCDTGVIVSKGGGDDDLFLGSTLPFLLAAAFVDFGTSFGSGNTSRKDCFWRS